MPLLYRESLSCSTAPAEVLRFRKCSHLYGDWEFGTRRTKMDLSMKSKIPLFSSRIWSGNAGDNLSAAGNSAVAAPTTKREPSNRSIARCFRTMFLI